MVLLAAGGRGRCDPGEGRPWTVSPILAAMDFSKWIKIYPQLWGEGSLPRTPLEERLDGEERRGVDQVPALPPPPPRGRRAFVERRWSPHLAIAGSRG